MGEIWASVEQELCKMGYWILLPVFWVWTIKRKGYNFMGFVFVSACVLYMWFLLFYLCLFCLIPFICLLGFLKREKEKEGIELEVCVCRGRVEDWEYLGEFLEGKLWSKYTILKKCSIKKILQFYRRDDGISMKTGNHTRLQLSFL